MVDASSWTGGAAGGAALGAILALGIALAVIIFAAFYVYTSLAWMTIGKRLKYKRAWLAWIPIANIAMMLQLGGFSWLLIFLLLIPILGWIAIGILVLVSTWRIFEKRKYPGWLALIPLLGLIPGVSFFASIAFLIVLGLVAWKS
jgi:hypothetical protein